MESCKSFVLWISAAIAGAIVLVIGASAHIEPFWILASAAGIPGIVLAVRRFPAAFIPVLIFVSALKTRPSAGFSPTSVMTDPTFIAIVLLYGAVFLNILLVLSGSHGPSMQERFAGLARPVAAFCLFMAVITFSFLYSPVHLYALEKLTKFTAISGVLFVAPVLLLRDKRDFNHFVWATLVLGLLTGAKVLLGIARPTLTVAAKYTAQGVAEQDVTRIGPGQLIGMTLLLLIFCHLLNRPFHRLVPTICVPFLVAALVASTSRGPLLSFALVLGISALIPKLRAHLMSSKLMAFGILALTLTTFALALVWIGGTAARTKFETKKQELVQILTGSSAPSYTAGKRLEFYKHALMAISEKPWVGWGLGGWSYYYNHGDSRTYPHNIFMEVGTEQGLLGLAALVLILAAMVLSLQTIWKDGRNLIFLLPVLAFSFCVTLLSGDLDYNRALWMWCGVALAASRIVKTRWKREVPPSPTLVRGSSLVPQSNRAF